MHNFMSSIPRRRFIVAVTLHIFVLDSNPFVGSCSLLMVIRCVQHFLGNKYCHILFCFYDCTSEQLFIWKFPILSESYVYLREITITVWDLIAISELFRLHLKIFHTLLFFVTDESWSQQNHKCPHIHPNCWWWWKIFVLQRSTTVHSRKWYRRWVETWHLPWVLQTHHGLKKFSASADYHSAAEMKDW